MLHRLSILMILASWSFAWFSASVHVHHPGHDCHHDVAESVDHSHSGTHSHCHSHGKISHTHSKPSEQTDENSSEHLPSVSGGCPLCDLIALELASTPIAEVAPSESLLAEAQLSPAADPASARRYALRGRAPPIC
jgi:hypothetical protein